MRKLFPPFQAFPPTSSSSLDHQDKTQHFNELHRTFHGKIKLVENFNHKVFAIMTTLLATVNYYYVLSNDND